MTAPTHPVADRSPRTTDPTGEPDAEPDTIRARRLVDPADRHGAVPLVDGEPAPTRVLYVLKRYPRLSETFVVREILGLEAAGVTVGIDALLPPESGPRHPEVAKVRATHLVLPRRPRTTEPSVAAAHLRVGVRHPVRWAEQARTARRRPGGWRRFLQAGMVADRARREGFEHLHAHFATAAAEVAAIAGRLADLPWSVTAHAKDIYAADNASLLHQRVASASVVVTVTDHNVDHLRHVLGTAPAPPDAVSSAPPVRLVHNGVARGPAHGPTPSGPVTCVARLVEKKGIDLLVDAVALLARRGRSVPVVIVGDGPERDALVARAAALGVAELVTFTGAVDSDGVAAAYARASVVVLPCRVSADGDRDGLPTVLTEALARALPVVSTDVVGIPELVQHERTGLLVPPEDPEALARAIEAVLDDEALARRLGRAGRTLVAERYSPEAATTALLAAFAAGRAVHLRARSGRAGSRR